MKAVRHRSGWCAARLAYEEDFEVATLCEHVVALPWGISDDLDLVDCSECRAALDLVRDFTRR